MGGASAVATRVEKVHRYLGHHRLSASTRGPGCYRALQAEPSFARQRASRLPFFFFFFFFLGYRIVVHSFQAKEPSGHQTNLRYAGTTA